MQNNINDLLNFSERIYSEVKNRYDKKNIFMELKDGFKENERLNDVFSDFISFEALYVSYMHIMGVNTLNDLRDPIALLSMHIKAMYPNRPSLLEDERVSRFFVAFKHKSERFLMYTSNEYKEYMESDNTNNMFIIEKLENTTKITLKEKLSPTAYERYKLYIDFINGKIEEVNYMHVAEQKQVFTKSSDFEGRFQPYISNKDGSKGVSNTHLYINELEEYSTPGTKVPKKLREEADVYHLEATKKGRLIERLNEANIKRKQEDRKNGIMTVLDDIDIRSESLYDIGLHYPKVYKQLKLLSVDGQEISDSYDMPIILSNRELQILGPTGSGKSVTIEALLFYLMKKGIKVTYVCSEVSQAIALMRRMLLLTKENNENLPSPYLNIGQDRFGHEVNFLMSTIRKENPELANSLSACNVLLDPIYAEVFKQLNSSCFLKDSLGFYKTDKTKGKNNKVDFRPCQELKTGTSSKRWCSLYSQCGAHERYKVMNEATLWITTNASLFLSSVPLQWDKHKSNILETSVLHADVIIIDEADAIEYDSDNQLIQTLTISKEKARSSNDYDAKALIDAIKTHSTYLVKSSYSNAINRMLISTDLAQIIDKALYSNLKNMSPEIHKCFTKKFTKQDLIDTWLKEFTFRTVHHPGRIAKLKGEEYDHSEFTRFINSAFELVDKSIKTSEYVTWITSLEDCENVAEEYKKKIGSLIGKFLYNLRIDENTKKTYIIKPNKSTVNENIVEVNLLNVEEDVIPESENLDMYYLFDSIILISKLQKLLNHEILPNLSDFRYKLDSEPDARSIENSLQNINGQNKHYQYTPTIPVDITGFKYFKKPKQRLELQMTVAFGVGREVLRNANKCLAAIYNCRPAQIVYTSATSRAVGSSLYNIESPVASVIRNKSQDKQTVNINIERYIIDDSVFFLSGTNPEYLEDKLRVFTSQYLGEKNGLLHELNEKQQLMNLEYGEATPITLILTNSYPQANWVGEELAKTNWISSDDVAILYSYNSSGCNRQEYHITKEELENLYARKCRILVAPIDVISRGYNILRSGESDKSLISDIVFMFRPYPSPEDYLSLISLITHKINGDYFKNNKKNGREGYEALQYVTRSSELLYSYLQDANSWSKLGKSEQRSISINQLVSRIVQTIGRGRRGGTDVTAHFVDGALCGLIDLELTAEQVLQSKGTMISYWLEFLNADDSLTDSLYKKIKDGFNNLSVNTRKY